MHMKRHLMEKEVTDPKVTLNPYDIPKRLHILKVARELAQKDFDDVVKEARKLLSKRYRAIEAEKARLVSLCPCPEDSRAEHFDSEDELLYEYCKLCHHITHDYGPSAEDL